MLRPKGVEHEQLELFDAKRRRARAGNLPEPDFPWTVPKSVYLWTLTFADPEPSYEDGRERYANFLRGYLSREGFFGVCVPEFGKSNGRLHFHLVTTRRPDAKEINEACRRYGFGRFNVRQRPAWRKYGTQVHEAVWYLAKYVGKRQNWPEALAGMRQWSVFGEKHFPTGVVKVRDVRITETSLTVVEESPRPFHDFSEWRFSGDMGALRVQLRPDALPGGYTIMREINETQQKKVLGLVASGDVVGVGEYRVGVIEKKLMEAYKNGRATGTKVERLIVTHKVDFGAALERREFDELLPEGADEKTVTFPAKSGDLVAVCVDGMRAFNGGTNYKGRIINLNTATK